MPHRRVIGIFTAQLDDAYQIALWRGIESRAAHRGVGVVCFVGHRIDSPLAGEAAANVAYRIARRGTIDGLIVVTSAIATFLDRTGIRDLFAQRTMPQVSIGLEVDGIPSIRADGSQGVARIVRHLVSDHGRRRFALIGGPVGHAEALDRERAFRATLAELGIDFDERLALNGTFLRTSGAEAARDLLRLRVPFDALVCMNDRMALGAMEVLRAARIGVPEDIAVVGFDGIEEGRYVTPPLTTVMQPLRELGSSAVDSLLDLMEGRSCPERILSCTTVIRQSCGCPPRRSYDAALTEVPADASPEERRAIEEMVREARAGATEAFVAAFNRALAATTLAGREPGRWNDYLSAIHHQTALPGGERSVETASLVEFARVLIGEAESRLQASRRVAAENRLATLRAISASLAGAFEIPVMLSRLESGLARLGIGGGYIALFDQRHPPAEWSRLVMAPRGGEPGGDAADGMKDPPEEEAEPAAPGSGPHPRGIRFRSARLLPPRVAEDWRQGFWVLEPLVFQNEPLGYMLLPGGAEEPAVYDTLREQVASALKGALLLDQVLSHERRLQIEVARRTGELTRTNRELTQAIDRRMRLEKEVIEISNRTMQRIGQDLHDDLCQHLAGIALHVSVLRGVLSAAEPRTRAAVEQIGALLAESITRAKRIARGLSPAGLEERGLVAAVEELVQAARRTYPALIDFRASPDFRLPGTDRALQVYRIVQEALSNALKHSGSARIEVHLYREETGAPRGRAAGRGGVRGNPPVLVAEVTDYGTGLPSSITGTGMGLRIMRYRAETAGIVLNVEKLDPGTRVSCRIDATQGES